VYFLQNILPVLLEEIDLHRRQNVWLQQDAVPPHFHRDVRRYLDTVYANKWIGRGSINPWPPRSPDIAPLDSFLWEMVKERVYQTPVNSREDLEHRITVACRSATPVLLMRVRGSFRNRIDACETSGGSILNISLFDSLNFYVLFVIKTFFALVFQLLLSMSKNDNDKLRKYNVCCIENLVKLIIPRIIPHPVYILYFLLKSTTGSHKNIYFLFDTVRI
jgi:hypothetical protein